MDEHQLEQCIGGIQTIDEVTLDILSEMAIVFNVDHKNRTPEDVKQKLKHTLCRVSLTEGYRFGEYLQLPKFQTVSRKTNQVLLLIFMKLWTLHSSRESKSILNELHPTTDFQQLPEGNTVFEMYPTIPDTNSFQKRDNDQGGFTLYQQYPANSYSLLNQPAVSYPAMYHPLFLNYSYSSQGSLFDMLDQSARKVPPQNGNIFFNAHNSEPNLDNQQLHKPQEAQIITTAKVEETHRQETTSQANQSVRKSKRIQKVIKHQVRNGQHKHKENQPGRESFKESEESVNEDFARCRCHGRQMDNFPTMYPVKKDHREEETSFRCECCQYRYHFYCLQINETKEICPWCLLTLPRTMNRLIGQPIKGDWTFKAKDPTLLELNEQEINNLKESESLLNDPSKEMQLRLIRIDANIPTDRKQRKDSLTLEPQMVRRMINDRCLLLEHLEGSGQSKLKPKGHILLYYVICVVQHHESAFIENRLIQEETEQRSRVKEINLMLQTHNLDHIVYDVVDQNTNVPVKIPVRGSDCNHSQVFDLHAFLDNFDTRVNEVKCPICLSLCNPFACFKLDALLFELMNFYSIAYPQKAKPSKLKYTPEQSSIEWIYTDNEETNVSLLLRDLPEETQLAIGYIGPLSSQQQ